jgi:hypothetical protein
LYRDATFIAPDLDFFGFAAGFFGDPRAGTRFAGLDTGFTFVRAVFFAGIFVFLPLSFVAIALLHDQPLKAVISYG